MAVDAPVFRQDGGLNLYWLEGAAAIAYLPSAGSSFSDPITLAQAWADSRGVYLFLDARPADTGAALPLWRAFVTRLGFAGALRFVWLQTAGLSPSAWRASVLQVTGPASGNPAATALAQPAKFDASPYALFIGQGSIVTIADAGSGWGFTVTATNGHALLWGNPATEIALTGATLNLPFSGAGAGCLSFGLPVSDFSALGAGVSYFYDDTDFVDAPVTDNPPPRQRTGYVSQLFLPLFDDAATMTLAGLFDPAQPLNGARSHLVLPNGAGAPAMACTLASPRGHSIAMTPLPASGSVPDARLVFQDAAIYREGGQDYVPPYYLHLVPEGAFTLSVSVPLAVQRALAEASQATPPWVPVERLVCGISGMEYIGLSAAAGCQIIFRSGQAGYAVNAAEGVAPADTSATLSTLCRTAWAQVLPPAAGAALNYFSQPEQAPLYGATALSAASTETPIPPPPIQSFLYFNELPSVQLNGASFYPLAPYRGVESGESENARRVEATGVAPARRNAIIPPVGEETADDPVLMKSVTPQGLLVTWDQNNPSAWSSLVLGNDVDPVAQENNLLTFTRILAPLRTALQTNRLMMVAACPDTFWQGGSVRYGPRADTFAGLLADAPGDAVYTAVSAWYKTNGYPESADETAFQTLLDGIPGITIDTAHFKALRLAAGLLNAKVSGWRFPFSPWTWAKEGAAQCASGTEPGTLVILKFAPGKLSDLAADVAAWAWSDVSCFGGSPAKVRDKLLAVIVDARTRHSVPDGPTSPYDHFIDQVVDNPYWSGVLVLGCPVPLTSLPKPLECLAAGIDPAHFVAHHIGLNATAFQVASDDIVLSQTSMFGLIDYRSPKSLHLDPSPDAGFAYQVRSLTVEFRNSAIRSFACSVELLLPHLFGSQLTQRDTQRGNCLLMNGTFQRPAGAASDAEGTYVFRLVGADAFDVTGSVLRTVDITGASFGTTVPADTSRPDALVQAQFRLAGRLTFTEFTDFDVLGYGPGIDEDDALSNLGFNNLLLNLSFPYYHPEQAPVFREEADKLSVDATSVARKNAMISRFPVRLAGLTGIPSADGAAPRELGYVTADTPLPQSRLEAPWWGILYEIDLGTSGALSAGSALTLTVLAAWTRQGVRDDSPPLFVGVHLPGLRDLVGANLPFESFLRLGFKNIQFSAYDTADGRAYMLRFRRFLIGVLGLSFPPGNMDIVLFGNPDGSKGKVGWYAAYSADDDEKRQLLASPARLRRAARRGQIGRS